jgi:Rrf2 family protein
MAESCRFAFAVHILAVLARQPESGVTSQALAASVNTNPVVVRRLLCALQRADLVVTQKGAGAGSRLGRSPEAISLAEIYRAVEPEANVGGMHPQQPDQRCCVGRKIQETLREVFEEAQEALEAALARRSLAAVVERLGDDAPRRAVSSSSSAQRKSA